MFQKQQKSKKNQPKHQGFTLLELIAVMGIMVALSMVVMGGYSSIMRSMAEMAGVNTLRKAVTLVRQHACIDAQRTYLIITSETTFVLCRKGGTIDKQFDGTLSGDDAPTYAGGQARAIWIDDRYSDLSASQEFVGEMDENMEEDFDDGNYSGSMIYDLGPADEDDYEVQKAYLTYPPWYVHKSGVWRMGVELEDGNTGFEEGNVYGWAVYPVQHLPEGYAFVDGKDNFIEIGSVSFNPNGTLNDGSLSELSVQELATGNVSTIRISDDGKITEK